MATLRTGLCHSKSRRVAVLAATPAEQTRHFLIGSAHSHQPGPATAADGRRVSYTYGVVITAAVAPWPALAPKWLTWELSGECGVSSGGNHGLFLSASWVAIVAKSYYSMCFSACTTVCTLGPSPSARRGSGGAENTADVTEWRLAWLGGLGARADRR